MMNPRIIKNLVLLAPPYLLVSARKGPNRSPCCLRGRRGRKLRRRLLGRIIDIAPSSIFATEATVHGLNDLLGDEADTDAVRVERREDLSTESGLELIELRLSELALDGG